MRIKGGRWLIRDGFLALGDGYPWLEFAVRVGENKVFLIIRGVFLLIEWG